MTDIKTAAIVVPPRHRTALGKSPVLERIAGLGNLGHRHRPARNDTLPTQHKTHPARPVHPGRRTGLYAARAARPRGGRSTGLQRGPARTRGHHRSEEHTSELQSPCNLVCRLLLEKKKNERL